MTKWLALGGVALLLLWAPFLYRELARSAPKGRAVGTARDALDDELHDEPPVLPPKPLLAVPAAEGAEAPSAPPAAPTEPAEPAEPVEPAEPAEPIEVEELPPAAPAEEDPETDKSESEKEESPVAAPISPTGPVSELKGTFEEETRDALWASGQESLLREMSAKYEFDASEADAVLCRRTVCRLSLHVSKERPSSLLEMYADISGHINNVLAIEPGSPGDDTSHLLLYVPRKGYALSDFTK